MIVRSVAITLWVCLMLGIEEVSTVNAQDEETCQIEILKPMHGAKVVISTYVEGTASIPVGSHLWILVKPLGTAKWYPQGAGPAELVQGEWVVLSTFGRPVDKGLKFQIAAVAVGGAANLTLERWVEESDRAQQWLPIPFPNPILGCTPKKIIVERSVDS